MPDPAQLPYKIGSQPALRRGFGIAIPLIAMATALQPVAGIEHTIAPGEALSTIASTYDVSVDQLMAVNELGDPDFIVAGRTLTVPGGETATDSLPSVHSVEPGDTLWAISARYGVPLGALARQNQIGGDAVIFPGQSIELPRAADPDLTDPIVAPEDVGDEGEGAVAGTTPVVRSHVVAPGDSLWAIAVDFEVSVDDLLTANGLERSAVLRPGQRILVTSRAEALAELPEDLRNDPGRLALLPVFDAWAGAYGIPADLLKSLAWFESGWNNEKVSSADALGIGQVLPITADFVNEVLLGGQSLDLNVPEENIQVSARYLRYLLDNAGSVRLAVASYYQGLTATRQHGIYESSEFYVDGILALRARFD
ncbi:MAG: LysM peptidoglycan-binding domain-containing protein [Acidimicrobiia bacterium]